MTNSQYLDVTGTTSVVNKLKGKLNEKASNSDVQLVVNEVVQLGQEMEFKLNVDLDNITKDGLAKIQESTDNRYLQLTGGTLTGHLLLGGGTETAFKKVEAIRNINGTPNAAAFYVNSDGTAAFFHKTYGTTALGGAVNDAILQFNNEGLKFAKGATNRTTASTFYNVLTDEYPYLKAVAVSADGKTLSITDKDNNTTEFKGGGGGDDHFKYNPTEEFTDGIAVYSRELKEMNTSDAYMGGTRFIIENLSTTAVKVGVATSKCFTIGVNGDNIEVAMVGTFATVNVVVYKDEVEVARSTMSQKKVTVPNDGSEYVFEYYNSDPTAAGFNVLTIPDGSKLYEVIEKSGAFLVNKSDSQQLATEKYVDEKVIEASVYKYPNVTLFGDLEANGGQLNDFSTTDYAQFPFLVDFKNRAFEINMCFTTGNNIENQQNIIDSQFGLALAVRNNYFVMAMSSDGSTWDMGEHIGTLPLAVNRTYYLRLSFDGVSTYKLDYSYDREVYSNDMTFTDERTLYPKTIVIGKAWNNDNVFGGSINLNYCNMLINGVNAWEGMDDVGLTTRLATDLSNIDNSGVEKMNDLIQLKTINGQSLKGSGNIVIQGGGGGGDEHFSSFVYANSLPDGKGIIVDPIVDSITYLQFKQGEYRTEEDAYKHWKIRLKSDERVGKLLNIAPAGTPWILLNITFTDNTHFVIGEGSYNNFIRCMTEGGNFQWFGDDIDADIKIYDEATGTEIMNPIGVTYSVEDVYFNFKPMAGMAADEYEDSLLDRFYIEESEMLNGNYSVYENSVSKIATEAYVDSVLGDINKVLDAIIGQ